MSKRASLLLITALGVLAILFVLFWFFLFPRFRAQPSPRPLSGGGEQITAPTTTRQTPPKKSEVPPVNPDGTLTPEEQERQAEELLKQAVTSFIERAGNYSSFNQFSSLVSVYPEATTVVQAFLEAERQKLLAAHPATGASWGQTRHVLSARLTSPLPVQGRTDAEVTLQAQERIDSSGQTIQTSYVEFVVSVQKQGSLWLVSRISSTPLAL